MWSFAGRPKPRLITAYSTVLGPMLAHQTGPWRPFNLQKEEPGVSLPDSSYQFNGLDGKDRNDPHVIIHDDDFVLVDEVLATTILRINLNQDRRHLDQVDRPRDNSANPDREVYIRYLGSSGDHGFPNVGALFGR